MVFFDWSIPDRVPWEDESQEECKTVRTNSSEIVAQKGEKEQEGSMSESESSDASETE